MGYSSKHGRRPDEYASKSSHGYIIKDPDVASFLDDCSLPKYTDEILLPKCEKIEFTENPIKHIIAIDGGYSEVSVREEFPSSQLAFFQFGALIFDLADLNAIAQKAFIDPEDISKLNNIQRYKLVLPTKNVITKDSDSLIQSVRDTVFKFFLKTNGGSFIKTLKWFLFEDYEGKIDKYNLASCPSCGKSNIELERRSFSERFDSQCPNCSATIYLTDVFRLHEAVDNEIGAGGILGYVTTLIEQFIIVDLLRIILETKPALLGEIIILKDGPLAFFGQTAGMNKPMRSMTNFLLEKHNLFLVGLEKSGAFVEHAVEIAKKMENGSVLLLNNDYIYKYIIPGKADPSQPYARSSYYGSKVIFKASDERIYVATLPTKTPDVVLNPSKNDFKNIDIILSNVEKLKCDMYDNSLFPVALANKLVSLADHPSSVILEKFAKQTINNHNS
ncbi:MAG TPA: NurA domain-containing protein [Candidatus Paceibacterota bacterium]|nr:NurA domain-containing protein [Candidatus Paceibacterota bacterium]